MRTPTTEYGGILAKLPVGRNKNVEVKRFALCYSALFSALAAYWLIMVFRPQRNDPDHTNQRAGNIGTN
jgi:hypothetical protein